jgi:hypothetical protein
MPSLLEYRSSFSVEAGPFIGPESYVVRATDGSTTTKLVCSQYPITSGMAIRTSLLDRPLYRPTVVQELDKYRYVMDYDPSTGTVTPDLPWITPLWSLISGNTYEFLENYTYFDLEAYLYQDLEGLGVDGIGERFEIGGPFDVPTTHRLINDGLKQCWLVVEVACIPTANATRHTLEVVSPWLQDTTDVLQVGYLAPFEDRNEVDPFERIVQGQVERDGGEFFLNTWTRSFVDGELIYLRCLKRAYDHCRPAGGEYGEQSGLSLEDDESPVEREWLTSSALTIAWRRFGHLLEPMANQRLIRDQQTAAAWFSDQCRKHFSEPLPARTLKRKRVFGPMVLSV